MGQRLVLRRKEPKFPQHRPPFAVCYLATATDALPKIVTTLSLSEQPNAADYRNGQSQADQYRCEHCVPVCRKPWPGNTVKISFSQSFQKWPWFRMDQLPKRRSGQPLRASSAASIFCRYGLHQQGWCVAGRP
jgi:hypothetical protein